MVAVVMSISVTPIALIFLDMGDVFAIVAGSNIAAGIGAGVFVNIWLFAEYRIAF